MDNDFLEEARILKIPKKRVGCLIKHKEDIEKSGKVKLKIGEEIIVCGEPIHVFETCSVIKAIGRGFSFEEASEIFGGASLYVIEIAKERKTLLRIRSRLIGTRGKVKKKIEEATGTKISVFGKTVSIIGTYDGLETARSAVEKIIEGKSHAAVFKFLEAKNKD